MKTFLKQCLSCSILCIVLLASAVPFAVWAQSGEKTDAAPKAEAKTAADSEEVILTFEATVDETGLFFFQNDAIEYRKSFEYPDPTGVTVDGKPWEDLSKPFRLGFTPDYGKAAIVEKQGRGRIELSTMPNQIILLFVDKESSSAPYKVSIAVKNQRNREPEPSLIRPQSSPQSTDGRNHPDYPVTQPVYPPDIPWLANKIVIKGTVDLLAGFRIQDSSVFYQNYIAYPRGRTGYNPYAPGGKYASGITVNGKKWSDLSTPFNLSFAPKISSCMQFVFNAEHCGISYSIHDDVIEITVENKDGKPASFETIIYLVDPDSNNRKR